MKADCRAVRSDHTMCSCPTPIILYIRRPRSHQHKTSSKNNSGSDSDGGAKTHLYRTAKFPRVSQTGKFGCFCFLCLVKHSRAPPIHALNIQKINAED